MMTNIQQKNPYLAALEWHIAQGADEGISDIPVDRTAAKVLAVVENNDGKSLQKPVMADIGGTSQMVEQAQNLAQNCQTLADLSAAISAFEGIPLKKTATNMVFGDGNPRAKIMVVGEAPGNDDDKTGVAFSGEGGRLLDKILASIGLSRLDENPEKAVYVTNILNWRPPGNRTPNPAELEISLPFLQRHIALVAPDHLILCGGAVAKSLLGSTGSITKLRGGFHNFSSSRMAGGTDTSLIPSIVTYPPAHLLNTPSLKKAVWMDMLMLAKALKNRP